MCVAVLTTPAGQAPNTFRWTRKSGWSSLAKLPPLYHSHALAPWQYSISCAAGSSFCMAVGRHANLLNLPGGWRILEKQSFSRAFPIVSCSTSEFCMVVSSVNSFTWSRSTGWHPTRIIPRGDLSYYDSLSCPTPKFCMVISILGLRDNYVLEWHQGKGWSAPYRIPVGLPESVPVWPGSYVSCPSPQFCAMTFPARQTVIFWRN